METAQVLSSLIRTLNLRFREVAAETHADEWLRRAAPGTNLLAFSLWHVARAIDADVQMGIRGVAEVVERFPWSERAWARPGGLGVGYTIDEADQVAQMVVIDEVIEYADVVTVEVSEWLKTVSDAELGRPSEFIAHARASSQYGYPAFAEQIAWMEGRPVWAILSVAVFAHSWGHLAEMQTLRKVLRG